MKTTPTILAGGMLLLLVLRGGITVAGPLGGTTDILVAAASASQVEPSQTRFEDRRQQAADLLHRARQAMAENDLQAADALISAAEALGVKYNVLYLGDTPQKARRDLQRKQSAAAKSPTRPSQLFSPFSAQKKQASRTDPFARLTPESMVAGTSRSRDGALPSGDDSFASATPSGPPGLYQVNSAPQLGPLGPFRPAAADQSTTPLDPFGRRMTGPSPAYEDPPFSPVPALPGSNGLAGATPIEHAYGPPSAADPAGSSSLSDAAQAGFSPEARRPPAAQENLLPAGPRAPAAQENLLPEARRALALGDLQRAKRLVAQAKQANLTYNQLGDTPEKVEATIAAYQDLATQANHTEAYRRTYTRLLMEQAEALLQAGDYDFAEQLADRASRERLTYGPFEAKPDDLLARIAAARRQSNPAASNTLPPTAAAQPAAAQPTAAPTASLAARQRATELVRQARQALDAGQFSRAEILARQADQLGIPDSAYAPNEDRPGLVLFDIRRARHTSSSATDQAGTDGVVPATGRSPAAHTASPALYDSLNDPTRNLPVAGQQPIPSQIPRELDFARDKPIPSPGEGTPVLPEPAPPLVAGPGATAESLFQQGEAALKAHNRQRAYRYFQQAAGQIDQLDPFTRQRLQGYLQLLSAPIAGGQPDGSPQSMVDETAASQQVLARQVSAEVAQDATQARAMLPNDPQGALALLEAARKKVASAGLEPASRERLLQRVDRHLEETRQFIEQNRPQIELQAKNQRTREDLDRQQRVKLETQEKLALMVDEFNKLMDEQRYEEAEVVAKRAAELDPDNPLIVQLRWQSTFVRRFMRNQAIRAASEEGYIAQLESVDESAIGFDDRNPIRFPDAKDWHDLTPRRAKFAADRHRQRTEADMEIERKLRTKVSLQFKNEPLSSVLDKLAKLTGVNIFIDPQALAEYGVATDTPVTIEVPNEIMLKSALDLILEPLRLSYVIKDEVLKVTSEQQREGEVYTEVYSVADLVVPIPNFVAGDMGLASAYQKALGNTGYGYGGPFGGAAPPLAVVASRDGNPGNAMINPTLLAQISRPGRSTQAGGFPVGFGPGGLSGGSGADFDSLIELITSTIQPTTWDDAGGPGSIAPFETNLSLVVSQTQDVHEEIVDLLEQLRRLQDLQVTIEVRFITLNDNFFERIGVDFDFDLDDDINTNLSTFGRAIDSGNPATGTEPTRDTLDTDIGPSVVVGMQEPGVFSADLDIPFTQNSYGLAVPQFGGFDATAGAQLGFAILSDIEAFFFINAAQGDRRSNVLQAPKVTLFNGQQAFVADSSQRPFVMSVIPVVGDFAAAQQPVIVVLSEGTVMTVQAVVSPDRRFVRLTVVPFFSKIGDVNTFQFTGSQTTTTNTSADSGAFVEPDNADNNRRDNVTNSANSTRTSSGVAVQLPTFSFVTVTTTVSVPDGGTVLLGGIKRLSEGRNEFGVPMLDKIPYINRLFKNVGIGRETESLMMMVTPRIIIQEEEEQKLGITPPP